MRLWSVATSRAGFRVPSGSRTRIEVGLVDEVEGAGNDVAVADRRPVRSSGRCRTAPVRPVPARRPSRSGPPTGPRDPRPPRGPAVRAAPASSAAARAARDAAAKPSERKERIANGERELSDTADVRIVSASIVHLLRFRLRGVARPLERHFHQAPGRGARVSLHRVFVVDLFQLRLPAPCTTGPGGRRPGASGRRAGAGPGGRRAGRGPGRRRRACAPARREPARFPATPGRARCGRLARPAASSPGDELAGADLLDRLAQLVDRHGVVQPGVVQRVAQLLAEHAGQLAAAGHQRPAGGARDCSWSRRARRSARGRASRTCRGGPPAA